MKRNPPPPPVPEVEIEDPSVTVILQNFPDAKRVSIRRMSDGDRWSHVGTVPADVFNEDYVQRRFGGGLYQCALHDGSGKLLRTVTNIEIADLPEEERKTTVVPAVTISERPSTSIEEMLRLQLAQQQTMILKLIESMGARPQSSMVEMVTALAQLKALEPKHERPPEVQELVLKSFTQGLELAAKAQGKISGESSPTSEILGFVRDVFKEAQPLITSMLTKTNPPARPVPGIAGVAPAQPLENPPSMEEELDLTPALTFIKDHLKNGFDPSALAHVVLAQMKGNPELSETVTAIVMEQPIEEIVELDTELAAEPLRTKFGEFFGVLRARISADAPTV